MSPKKIALKRSFLCFMIFLLVVVGFIIFDPTVVRAYSQIGWVYGILLSSPVFVMILGVTALVYHNTYTEEKYLEKMRKDREEFDRWMDRWVFKRRH